MAKYKLWSFIVALAICNIFPEINGSSYFKLNIWQSDDNVAGITARPICQNFYTSLQTPPKILSCKHGVGHILACFVSLSVSLRNFPNGSSLRMRLLDTSGQCRTRGLLCDADASYADVTASSELSYEQRANSSCLGNSVEGVNRFLFDKFV